MQALDTPTEAQSKVLRTFGWVIRAGGVLQHLEGQTKQYQFVTPTHWLHRRKSCQSTEVAHHVVALCRRLGEQLQVYERFDRLCRQTQAEQARQERESTTSNDLPF